MKTFLLTGILSLFFVFNIALAANEPPSDQSNAAKKARAAQKTCAYKYLECMDNCDYHQEQSKINFCKQQCNRSYSCRPKKVKLPKGATYEEG